MVTTQTTQSRLDKARIDKARIDIKRGLKARIKHGLQSTDYKCGHKSGLKKGINTKRTLTAKKSTLKTGRIHPGEFLSKQSYLYYTPTKELRTYCRRS